MQLQPWIIASWPIIERACNPVAELTTDLKHLGTTLSEDCDEFGRYCGHTIWGDSNLGIGVAWDWTEAHDGVFALSDPMGVVSNICFVEISGETLPEARLALQLNRIAHELPWQSEVAEATYAERRSNPWSRRAKSVWGGLCPVRKSDGPWAVSELRSDGPSSAMQSL